MHGGYDSMDVAKFLFHLRTYYWRKEYNFFRRSVRDREYADYAELLSYIVFISSFILMGHLLRKPCGYAHKQNHLIWSIAKSNSYSISLSKVCKPVKSSAKWVPKRNIFDKKSYESCFFFRFLTNDSTIFFLWCLGDILIKLPIKSHNILFYNLYLREWQY